MELCAHGISVEGEGRLQVGLVTEQDKAEAVALASFNKFTRDHLDGTQAVGYLVAEHHVLDFHAA